MGTVERETPLLSLCSSEMVTSRYAALNATSLSTTYQLAAKVNSFIFSKSSCCLQARVFVIGGGLDKNN